MEILPLAVSRGAKNILVQEEDREVVEEHEKQATEINGKKSPIQWTQLGIRLNETYYKMSVAVVWPTLFLEPCKVNEAENFQRVLPKLEIWKSRRLKSPAAVLLKSKLIISISLNFQGNEVDLQQHE